MNYSVLIDTSKPESYVALVGDGEILAKRQWKSDRTMSEKLLKSIDELLEEHNITLSQVKRYAVQNGPGHYSALRTGVVVATMLSQANKAELVAIESDDINEQAKELQNSEPVDNIKLVYE